MFIRSILSIVYIFIITGCATMIPDFTRPAPPIQNNSHINGTTDPTLASLIDTGWSDYFLDLELKTLIQAGIDNNRDLRLAALKVSEVDARYRIQRSALYPQVGATGRATFAGNSSTKTFQEYNLGTNLSYELDFFGRIRSMNEAELQQYFAAESAQHAAKLLLISQIAEIYIQEQFAIKRLETAKNSYSNFQNSYELILYRTQNGGSSYLDLQQALGLMETAQISIIQIEREILLYRNEMEFLTGVHIINRSSESDDFLKFTLPSVISSEILLSRPDVSEAEHLLMAANANIGAARAAFFPSISLTGEAGYISAELSDLFTGGIFWKFIPKIEIPIFAGGKNKANLQLAEIRKEAAVAEYEKTVQQAFKEVINNLISRESYAQQITAQNNFLKSQRTAANLAFAKFISGSADYIQLLDAERTVFEAERVLLDLKQAALISEVNLFMTLGGGR